MAFWAFAVNAVTAVCISTCRLAVAYDGHRGHVAKWGGRNRSFTSKIFGFIGQKIAEKPLNESVYHKKISLRRPATRPKKWVRAKNQDCEAKWAKKWRFFENSQKCFEKWLFVFQK